MNKISKSKIYILGVICVLVMCISGIYAFTNISILTAKTEFNTGAINIELKEYKIDNMGKEVAYTDEEQSVLPGQVVSFIPRISNLGDSCYIRAKVTYSGIDNLSINISNNASALSEDWVKHGDYLYYKKIVNPGESVDVFKEFTIPKEMTNEFQGKNLQVSVIAEAVQAKNFEPQFDSNSPWNDIVAQKATNDEYKTDKVQVSSNVKIDYENNADKYISVPDNFFTELQNILPGDVISETVKINNTSSKENEYFISTSAPENISKKALELLSKLELVITNGDKVIYQGDLSKVDNCSLGTYKSKEGANIQFKVNVPLTLGNEYSALSGAVNWNFSVAEKTSKPDEPAKEPEKVPEKEPEKEPVKEPVPNSPQTGETKVIIAITMFVISTIGLIILFIIDRRMKKFN